MTSFLDCTSVEFWMANHCPSFNDRHAAAAAAPAAAAPPLGGSRGGAVDGKRLLRGAASGAMGRSSKRRASRHELVVPRDAMAGGWSANRWREAEAGLLVYYYSYLVL
uniref:Uncharacterized protein n=1 Tax=Oryza nivara TaxID=4536 RepID=A0A0E0FIB8_ORYNI